MNSDQVFDVVEEIAQASGKIAKETMVGENLIYELFEKVVKQTYDPFRTYGVKKMLDGPTFGHGVFNEGTFELLDGLAYRTITGNQAQAEITAELTRLTEKSGTLLKRIITKSLKAGFTASTVNRVSPGLIFVFECQLAHPYYHKKTKAPRPVKFPVAIEPKYDGNRAILIKKGATAALYSRTGNIFEAVQHIADEAAERLNTQGIENVILDGEITNGSFLETVGAVRRKDELAENAVFVVFDIIPHDTFPMSATPYLNRRNFAKAVVETLDMKNVVLTPAKIGKCQEDIDSYCASIQAEGGEGVIVKEMYGKYKAGRSYDWLKIKGEETVDVQIVGFEPGEKGKRYEHTLGAFIVDFNGQQVKVSNMKEQVRHEVWASPGEFLNRLIEVEYHEETEYGSLRHPRFKRFRDDKPVEDGVGC